MSESTKFILEESKLPQAWYNINADMPVPPEPVLHPQTLQPVTPDFLSVLFPMSLIMQRWPQEKFYWSTEWLLIKGSYTSKQVESRLPSNNRRGY